MAEFQGFGILEESLPIFLTSNPIDESLESLESLDNFKSFILSMYRDIDSTFDEDFPQQKKTNSFDARLLDVREHLSNARGSNSVECERQKERSHEVSQTCQPKKCGSLHMKK